jgi:signal peptidase I
MHANAAAHFVVHNIRFGVWTEAHPVDRLRQTMAGSPADTQDDWSHLAKAAAEQRFDAKLEICRWFLGSGMPLCLRVTGTSMVPALWPGERVFVHPVQGEVLKPGDVVVFAREHHFVVHRVAGRSSPAPDAMLFTQGDATTHPDLPVDGADVLGVVVAVHRMGRERAFLRRKTAAMEAFAWVMRRFPMAHCVLGHFNMSILAVAGRRAGNGRQRGGSPSAALRLSRKLVGTRWQKA